jgi:histidinol-phosphate aminotransferase
MAAARQAGAGLAYVCNPNNPTGTIVSGDELPLCLTRAGRHDDPRRRGVPLGGSVVPSALDLTPSTRTSGGPDFSKIYGMAGLRQATPSGRRSGSAKWRSTRRSRTPTPPSSAAALASLDDPDLVTRQRSLLNDTRRWLVAEMDRQGRRTIPSHTNFVMIDVGGDVKPVIQAFRDRNILVGRKFPSLPNWLRVTMGTPDDIKAFAAALLEIVPAKAAA